MSWQAEHRIGLHIPNWGHTAVAHLSAHGFIVGLWPAAAHSAPIQHTHKLSQEPTLCTGGMERESQSTKCRLCFHRMEKKMDRPNRLSEYQEIFYCTCNQNLEKQTRRSKGQIYLDSLNYAEYRNTTRKELAHISTLCSPSLPQRKRLHKRDL